MSNQIEADETTKDETHPDRCMCEPCKADRQQRLNRVMKGPDDPPEEDTARPIREGIAERDAHDARVRLIRENRDNVRRIREDIAESDISDTTHQD